MSAQPLAGPIRYCGRTFTAEEMDRISALIASHPRPNRAQLSRLVCEALDWRRPDGRVKEMSARVAMLRMHRDGLMVLPPAQQGNGNGRIRPQFTPTSDPQEAIDLTSADFKKLQIRPVSTRQDSALWNELIERYHYLGYKPLPGDQIRYLISVPAPQDRLVALLGFGAAAWKVGPRDQFIGWNDEQRRHNLHRIVNNARFLILPWITARNLASRILSMVTRRMVQDWANRYGYQPVLLETFVERDRFHGTCYRAANWVYVGQTQGRGKLERLHRQQLPIKHIYLFPLDKHCQRKLRDTPNPSQ